MKNSQVRPRRESAHSEVIVLQEREAVVTQVQLAHIQQMQSDIWELHQRLQEETDKLRAVIIGGRPVQEGPIRAFIRKIGRKKTLIVK